MLSNAVGDLPGLNTAGLPNNNDARRVPDDQLILAGDVRANENIDLTSVHTLFLRERNRLADQIARANPASPTSRSTSRPAPSSSPSCRPSPTTSGCRRCWVRTPGGRTAGTTRA